MGMAATVGHNGYLTAYLDPLAFLYECAAFSFLAEAEVLEEENGSDRQAVIELREVDILWLQARHLICLAPVIDASHTNDILNQCHMLSL